MHYDELAAKISYINSNVPSYLRSGATRLLEENQTLLLVDLLYGMHVNRIWLANSLFYQCMEDFLSSDYAFSQAKAQSILSSFSSLFRTLGFGPAEHRFFFEQKNFLRYCISAILSAPKEQAFLGVGTKVFSILQNCTKFFSIEESTESFYFPNDLEKLMFSELADLAIHKESYPWVVSLYKLSFALAKAGFYLENIEDLNFLEELSKTLFNIATPPKRKTLLSFEFVDILRKTGLIYVEEKDKKQLTKEAIVILKEAFAYKFGKNYLNTKAFLTLPSIWQKELIELYPEESGKLLLDFIEKKILLNKEILDSFASGDRLVNSYPLCDLQKYLEFGLLNAPTPNMRLAYGDFIVKHLAAEPAYNLLSKAIDNTQNLEHRNRLAERLAFLGLY